MSSQALVYAKRSSPITLTVESPAVGTPAANQVQPPPSPRLHTHSTQGPRGASRTPRSLPASTACQYQRKRIAPPHAARPVLPLRVHPWSGPSLTDTSSPPPPPPPPSIGRSRSSFSPPRSPTRTSPSSPEGMHAPHASAPSTSSPEARAALHMPERTAEAWREGAEGHGAWSGEEPVDAAAAVSPRQAP